MLQALWFIIRLSALVYGVIWIAERPGAIMIEWQDYIVETSVGVLAAVMASLMIMSALLYRFWRAFISVPAVVRRYRKAQAKEKGYDAVTKGLVAVAAGDMKGAERQARRAKSLLPGMALTKLLSAQSALMKGDGTLAKVEFQGLLDDRSAAFFGVRGLLNEALKQGDHAEVLKLMRQAEKLQPKRGWVVQTLFDFETRMREWEKAEQTLSKAIRIGVVDRLLGQKHRQAILLARSHEAYQKEILHSALSFAKKAFNLNPGFVPAAERLAVLYQETNKRRAAVKTIEKSWRLSQHPILAQLWLQLKPAAKSQNISEAETNEATYQWMRQLFRLAPYGDVSQSAMGGAALYAGHYAEARELLKNAGAYRQLAKLEKLETGNETKAHEWMEMAADAPPKPQWVCDDCGHVSAAWHPLCFHCEGFDTYNWTRPSVHLHMPPSLEDLDTGFIEPPVV